MPAVSAVSPRYQFFDANGDPLVGGLLYTYLAGTTTPHSTWADQDQGSLNTNPIVLDARGEAVLWLDPAVEYEFALHDANDVLIWSTDDISGALTAGALANTTNPALGDALVGVKQPVTGAQATTQHEFNFRTLWLEDFGGVAGSADSSAALNAAFAAAEALGGAVIKIGRGRFTFNDVTACETSNVRVEGQGVGITVIDVNHNDGPGIRFHDPGGPGLSNCGISGLTMLIDNNPDIDAVDLIEADCVFRFDVSDVAGAGGRSMLRLKGCGEVSVRRVRWSALLNSTTRKYGLILEATLNPSALLPYGRDITVEDCDFGAAFKDGAILLSCGTGVRFTRCRGYGSVAHLNIEQFTSAPDHLIEDIVVDQARVEPYGIFLITSPIVRFLPDVAMTVKRLAIVNTTGGSTDPMQIGNANGTVEGLVVGNNTIYGASPALEIGANVTFARVWNNGFTAIGGTEATVSNASTSVTNRVQGQPIAFRANRITSSQTISATTATKVQFNGETFDPFNTFDSTTNYRWTPGVVGTVTIQASLAVTTPAAAGNLAAVIYKNGALLAVGANLSLGASSVSVNVTVGAVDQCLASDYYEIMLIGSMAGNKNVDAGSYFTGAVIQ